jgi:nucleoside-diphosphate-sugar epimerase
MKNVLIVGGAGYVGSAILDQIDVRAYHVRVYDSLLYTDVFLQSVDFIRGDVRDHAQLAPQLAWADVVIWLAAMVGDGACGLYPAIATQVNHEEVLWLNTHFNGKIIFPSTSMVYGVQDGALDESASLAPQSHYAKTKYAGEQSLDSERSLIVRLGSLFGLADTEGMRRYRFDLVANIFIRNAVIRHELTVMGPNKVRPLLHVRDVARVMINHIDTSAIGIYNLHWKNMTIAEMADAVLKQYPETQVETKDEQTAATGDYCMRSEAAAAALGFAPTHTYDATISHMGALCASGRIRDPFSVAYHNEGFLKHYPLN